MKKTVTLTAAGSLVALGAAAFADGIDQVVELGDWVVEEHEIGIVFGPSIDFTSDLEVTGFTFDVDYVRVVPDSSWASDLEMKLTNPAGETFVVGQKEFNGGDPFGPQDDIWDFDGPRGAPTAHYTSTHEFSGAAGQWNVMFAETWDGGVEYNNMTLTLHQIPGPGVLAAIGVSGLLLGARRRRA